MWKNNKFINKNENFCNENKLEFYKEIYYWTLIQYGVLRQRFGNGTRSLWMGWWKKVWWRMEVELTWESFIGKDFKENKRKKMDGRMVNGFEFSISLSEYINKDF